MRCACCVMFTLITTAGGSANAQTPASSAAVTVQPASPALPTPPTAAVAPPPSAAGAPDGYAPAAPTTEASGYQPTPPAQSATTHPQPGEYRVWRLVDPTEADWHAPDPDRPRGWVRIDTGAEGTTGYVGGSFRLADGLAFAPFAHVGTSVAQPNLALTWQLGGLWLMPALGTTLDFRTTRAVSLDPQLFAALDAKLLYVEVWAQYFIATIYHRSAMDTFKARVMLLLSVCSALGIGLEYDPSVATIHGPASSLLSSIFGGRTNLRIGDHDTMGLFLGYQTSAKARGSSEGIAGRFEFVHQW